jgi:YegS/Rv2252/BmrU family lipid kinase
MNPLLASFGGDGTFNELLNGADLARSTLALIPGGTGNVLAKELGLSRHPVRAAEQVATGRPVAMDVGVCNGRRFISMFGAGLDAWVVDMVNRRRGRRMSHWHYVPHVARGMLSREGWRIEVTVDGREFASGVGQVVIGNTHSYGGPIEMTPAASAHDGLLDVMCARLDGLAEAVGVAVCALLRALHLSSGVQYSRGCSFGVRAPSAPVPYQVDGEAAGFLPAAIEVLPGAARILAPAAYRTGAARE